MQCNATRSNIENAGVLTSFFHKPMRQQVNQEMRSLSHQLLPLPPLQGVQLLRVGSQVGQKQADLVRNAQVVRLLCGCESTAKPRRILAFNFHRR